MPGTRLKSREFMVQLDSLSELFSNASVTDRNLLADLHYNRNLVISAVFILIYSVFSLGKLCQK